uniref:Protein RFT1 homolog n=1 Tax=Ixodes ricinus TaxID=34613 RepID=A0A131Y1G9_IXORI
MTAKKNLVQQATKAASYNILLQVSLRVVTFVLNAFILRRVSKDVLGVVNVRLLLLYTTVQFLSREPFRRACLSNGQPSRWPAVINLAWFCVPVSVSVGAVAGFAWLFLLERPEPALVAGYPTGVCAIVVAVVIEMLAEPLYIVGQAFHYVKLRVFVEGASMTLRCVLMAALVTLYPQHAVWAFSVSQVAASCLYVAAFYTYFSVRKCEGEKLPFDSPLCIVPFLDGNLLEVDAATWKLTRSFMKQTLFKQVLTEGERYVMTLFSLLTFSEQGVYDVVNNLGSLAARFVFQPIEESGYHFFAQVLRRDKKLQAADDLALSAHVLDQLLKLMVHVGLIVLTFGQAYSALLLHLYGGRALSVGLAPTLLRWHSGYILFIALNGVTEAFVFAAMTREELDRHNHRLAAFSAIFLTVSYFLTTCFGAVGFIVANCFNMGARVIYSMAFIRGYYADGGHSPLLGLVPSWIVAGACGFSYLVTRFSEPEFGNGLGVVAGLAHVAVGAVCFLVVSATVYFRERVLFTFLVSSWGERKKVPIDGVKND